MPTYGTEFRLLKIGLQSQPQSFPWIFTIAQVTQPILGADFIHHYGLLPDLQNKCLLDQHNNQIKCISRSDSILLPCLNFIQSDLPSPYKDLLLEYKDLTHPNSLKLPPEHTTTHHIETSGPPIHCKPRRLHPTKRKLAKEKFDIMLSQGIIRPSKSPWASPLHLVPKKGGDWRPCGDYRRLNTVTRPDRYPLPHIHSFNDRVAGSKVMSKIDLVSAFHQIPVHPSDIEKTAVVCEWGLFEFLRMPFGLRNSPQTFQRFVDTVTRGLDGVFVYVDDILVVSDSEQNHLKQLQALFDRLRQYGLVINVDKSEFGKSSLIFLGHKLTADGITPIQSKIDAVLNYPAPTSQRSLRRFLGMVNYYHRFLQNAAIISLPLHALLKKTFKRSCFSDIWNAEAEQSFVSLKNALATASLLFHPVFSADTKLSVDASDLGAGAVLNQFINNKWCPLAFFSKAFSAAEKKYSAFDRELLATKMAVKHFKSFLSGTEFWIETDHKPLISAIKSSSDNFTNRQARHLEYISQFSSDLRHIKGQLNVVPDALSRVLCNILTQFPPTLDYQQLFNEQQSDSELQRLTSSSAASPSLVQASYKDFDIWCENSDSNLRPYIPQTIRKLVFEHFHGISHPGIKESVRLLSSLVFWPRMKTKIRDWARCCDACQKSKVIRHNITPLQAIDMPESRFSHIHLDLVGPLEMSNGYRYLLTTVDRFTRWPEAFPLADITTETIINSFVMNYMSRYGCPEIITTDNGRQFTSTIWASFMQYIGCDHIRTTAYHPQSNGMVERFHRSLKTSLKCAGRPEHWSRNLGLVLLGLRTSLREDLGQSSAALLYASSLRLPGQFFAKKESSSDPVNVPDFVKSLETAVQGLSPSSPRTSSRKSFVQPHLQHPSCTFAYLRQDAVKRPLQMPYTGPFKIINKSDKTFTLNIKGKNTIVSVDRLKAAHTLDDSSSLDSLTDQNNDLMSTQPTVIIQS